MSTEDARPWWASEDPEATGLDADEDPVEAVRTARRPSAGHGEASDPEGGSAGTADHDGAWDGSAICPVCPLCQGWRVLSEHQPEVAEHLAAAGRHLAEASPEVTEHLVAAGRHLTAAVRHLFDEDADERGSDGHEGEAQAEGEASFERIVVEPQDRG
jgi:hypothetical protein